jgi:hypothetical protein
MNKDYVLMVCQAALKDCLQYAEENGHGSCEAKYALEAISKVYLGPSCKLRWDKQTNWQIEVTMEDL